jgi:hypothetical protein
MIEIKLSIWRVETGTGIKPAVRRTAIQGGI